MNETLFVSDLHLSPERPKTIELFLRFLAIRAKNAEVLYILGDLFDAWIGDDDNSPPYPDVIAALRSVSDSGTELFIQHGNRDFLLGKHFAKATGSCLLKDHALIDLYGTPTLLMHGDLLCSDDIAYQRFRRFIRNPILIQLFLLRSLNSRRSYAANYRLKSSQATSAKPIAIMDVNQTTVEKIMRRFGARRLIHGHIHRPNLHTFFLNNVSVERWVLAEWHPEQAAFICANAAGIQHLIFE